MHGVEAEIPIAEGGGHLIADGSPLHQPQRMQCQPGRWVFPPPVASLIKHQEDDLDESRLAEYYQRIFHTVG